MKKMPVLVAAWPWTIRLAPKGSQKVVHALRDWGPNHVAPLCLSPARQSSAHVTFDDDDVTCKACLKAIGRQK